MGVSLRSRKLDIGVRKRWKLVNFFVLTPRTSDSVLYLCLELYTTGFGLEVSLVLSDLDFNLRQFHSVIPLYIMEGTVQLVD